MDESKKEKLLKIAETLDNIYDDPEDFLFSLKQDIENLQETIKIIENIDFIKGDKGEDGQPGKDGVNGRDGTDGKGGLDGRNGIDGKDGLDGKHGEDGKDGINGKDGSPDTGKEIVDKINALEIKEELQIEAYIS